MDTLTYAEGDTYRTIRIGNQVWMAENVRTEVSGIPHLLPGDINALVSLGRLYQLYDPETMSLRDVSPIMMPGWCLPDNDDWDVLVNVLRAEPNLIAAFDPAYAGEIYWHNIPSGLAQEAWYWSCTMSGADYDHTNQYCFRRASGGGWKCRPA